VEGANKKKFEATWRCGGGIKVEVPNILGSIGANEERLQLF